ncbi:hypothetical protein ACFL3C_00225 [Patescibacteria group bacterium]
MNENITIYIAIYGAILSTIVLIWNIIKYYLDKGRMELNCMLGNIVGYRVNDKKLYLTYTVTNKGNKPITITHAGGIYENKQNFLVNATEIPKKLEHGEYVTIKTPDLENLKDIKKLYVVNSLGQYCYLKRKKIKKLKESLKKYVFGSS